MLVFPARVAGPRCEVGRDAQAKGPIRHLWARGGEGGPIPIWGPQAGPNTNTVVAAERPWAPRGSLGAPEGLSMRVLSVWCWPGRPATENALFGRETVPLARGVFARRFLVHVTIFEDLRAPFHPVAHGVSRLKDSRVRMIAEHQDLHQTCTFFRSTESGTAWRAHLPRWPQACFHRLTGRTVSCADARSFLF